MSTALSRSKLGDAAQRLHQIIARCSTDAGRCRLAEEALSRIGEGIYGYCMRCGMQIPERDMDLMPERKCCPRCQQGRPG